MLAPALLALVLTASAAEEGTERGVFPHSIEVGLGQHHGLFGVRYTYRMPEWFAFSAGIGAIGASAAARFHPIGPLFAELSFAPLLSSGTWNSLYGPGLAAGVDLVRTRFAFTFEVGYALITPRVGSVVFDLGIGANFGRRHGTPDATDPS